MCKMSSNGNSENYQKITKFLMKRLERKGLLSAYPIPWHQINEDYEDLIESWGMSNIDQDELLRYIESSKISTFNLQSTKLNFLRKKESDEWFDPNNQIWKYFDRFRSYAVIEELFGDESEIIISDIDNITNRILNCLDNPNETDAEIISDRRGLVVGHVQSGKTANFIGLINKALDIGFNVIVVLTGMIKKLRRQTHGRIEKSVTGYHSVNNSRIGVGKLENYDHQEFTAETATSREKDFTTDIRKGFSGNIDNPKIFIVKKNKDVLEQLVDFFGNIKGENEYIDRSIILIDDEADNASLNKSSDPNDFSTINGYIRAFLNLFRIRAYVGYTATPFANIFTHFIDVDEADGYTEIIGNSYPVGMDLYPKDFIVALPKSDYYIGPEEVFGIGDDESDVEKDTSLPLISIADDSDEYFPIGHKRTDKTGIFQKNQLPYSLERAIRLFILSIVIKRKRNLGDRSNSMLIHVSRYTNWQNKTAYLVNRLLETIKSNLNSQDLAEQEKNVFHSIFDDVYSKNNFKKVVANIKYEDDLLDYFEWEEIEDDLEIVENIEVVAINVDSEDILDFEKSDNLIAIGGDALSRGITLEGLNISYFVRLSRYYDSLMQMGRWFGYRKGYIDVCRLFVPQDFVEFYQHISRANVELRDQFIKAQLQKYSPSQFRFKVLSHPGVLSITGGGLTKIHNKIPGSFSNQTVETYQYDISSKEKIVEDFEFIQKLTKQYTLTLKRDNELEIGYLLKEANEKTALKIVSSIKSCINIDEFFKSGLENYITDQTNKDRLKNWTIILRSPTGLQRNSARLQDKNGNEFKVNFIQRTKSNQSTSSRYYIRKARISDQRDEMIDFTFKEKKQIIEEYHEDIKTRMRENNQTEMEIRKRLEKSNSPPGHYSREARSPEDSLMIIYFIDPQLSKITELTDVNRNIPLIGYAISFPKSDKVRSQEYIQRS